MLRQSESNKGITDYSQASQNTQLRLRKLIFTRFTFKVAGEQRARSMWVLPSRLRAGAAGRNSIGNLTLTILLDWSGLSLLPPSRNLNLHKDTEHYIILSIAMGVPSVSHFLQLDQYLHS